MAESRLDQIIDLVRECGQLVKDADRRNLHVDSKAGHANFVTDYDKKVQDRLKSGLLKIMPDAHFMGEEGTTQEFSPKGKFFIVDPIDGTTNFIKDFRTSSISVALVVDGTARIHVSSEPLENGLVIFGTSPYNEELSERSFKLAYSYFRKAIDVRRTGSAALDMCSIAAGRAELFFELSLSPWDYAAGALIVEEAGGIVTDIDGNALAYDRKSSILARNKAARPIE